MARIVFIRNPDIKIDVPDHLYASYLSTKEWMPYKEKKEKILPSDDLETKKPSYKK